MIYSFGRQGEKQNELCEKFGKVWSKGDVVGCFVDIGQRSIAFSLNGQMMMDVTGRESAFDHFNIAGGTQGCRDLYRLRSSI